MHKQVAKMPKFFGCVWRIRHMGPTGAGTSLGSFGWRHVASIISRLAHEGNLLQRRLAPAVSEERALASASNWLEAFLLTDARCAKCLWAPSN
jgi:hypothetical protein